MELKIIRETIPVTELIYEGVQEQSIELDYILPDYCPDIFRLINCETVPTVTEYSISGDRLTYEVRCAIRILYCGEEDKTVRCVTQQQTFSKTVELGKSCNSADVRLVPKVSRMNFRAVNKRRLDLRGVVSVKICVTCDSAREVVSDAEGMNIQLRKIPVSFASNRITAERTVQLNEDIDIGSAQPDIISIISCRCSAVPQGSKLVSGKLLAKGEARISLLYSCENGSEGGIESMELTLPYSQIVEVSGADDSFEFSAEPETVSCEVSPTADKNGRNRTLRCEIELRLTCRAAKNSSLMAVADAFSTLYPCTVESEEISARQLPRVFSESFHCTAKLAEGDDIPQKVFAVRCTPKNINARLSEDGSAAVISGMMSYSTIGSDSGGMVTMPERDEAFEEKIPLGESFGEGSSISADLRVNDVSYNISDGGVLNAKSDISARLTVSSSAKVSALTDIAVDDSVKKQRDGDYAVKLYFGVENENVWDIAKRCSTSVEAVKEENELSGERLEQGGMLLIPIVY